MREVFFLLPLLIFLTKLGVTTVSFLCPGHPGVFEHSALSGRTMGSVVPFPESPSFAFLCNLGFSFCFPEERFFQRFSSGLVFLPPWI